jgi:hypothetical protein
VTFSDSLYNIVILFTTSNFPDVALPAYSDSRASILFFVIFLIIALYILLNLLLAVFYNNYKRRITNNVD